LALGQANTRLVKQIRPADANYFVSRQQGSRYNTAEERNVLKESNMERTMPSEILAANVRTFLALVLLCGWFSSTTLAEDPSYYVKKSTWHQTIRASREALVKLEESGQMRISLPDLGKSDFTFSAWIRTESEGGAIFAKAPERGAWAAGGKVLFLSDDTLAFDVGWVGAVEAGVDISDGKWHHVALAKAGELEFYADGRLVETGRLRMTPDVPDHVTKIGNCSIDFPDSGGFEGDIDEVRIYGRKLSAKEINAIYENSGQPAQGLAGFWRFESAAVDSSGNKNHGQIVRATPTDGKFGKALRFSGRSRVILPASGAVAARSRIRDLIARDFADEQSRREIRAEQQDDIWKQDWRPGDLRALGRRYAQASRGIGKLKEKAERLAADIKTQNDVEEVRDVYHLSRRAAEVYGSLGKKLGGMQKGIAYLQDNFNHSDVRWANYKQRVKGLTGTSEKLLSQFIAGDTTAIEKMSDLERELAETHSAVPLKLPAGPAGPGRFGAYYTKLKYSLEWDSAWRVGPDADVVVRFDQFGHRFVFWRGTSYIPCWVTDAGGWYTNEFFERRGGERSGTTSMVEPMSDKQARYSHVRILESNDARVVIHWRYAPVDLKYSLAYIDKESGWGDWVDEYYTIYPDAVGVRKARLYTSAPQDWIEYQESIVINQPGTQPEDNMHYAAVTLANMLGESHTYSWEHTWPDKFDKPADGNIQVVNLKGKTSPFSIVDPDGAFVRAYPRYEAKTKFHCWNHWPVAQEESDTTIATSFDKPSHTSLSHITWKPYAQQDKSRTWIMLHGMTDSDAGELAVLAKSWLTPPRRTARRIELYK
jgi:hypothetical protein